MTWVIPPQELQDFQNLLIEIAEETGKSIPDLLRYNIGPWFCQSARKITPISIRKRLLETNPDRRVEPGKAATGAKWRFRVYNQNGPPKWLYTNDRSDVRRNIQMRGAAKNTWTSLITKIKGRPQKTTGSADAARVGRKASHVNLSFRKDTGSIELINRLQYMPEIAPNVLEQSMEKTHKRLEGWMEQRAKRMQQQWRT